MQEGAARIPTVDRPTDPPAPAHVGERVPDGDGAPPDALAMARRMDVVGRLAPGLIHDLNNSLAAISGFSQLLRADARLPEELRGDTALLVEEAERTRRSIQTLLDFVRERPPERHPTSIAALVESVLELAGYPLRRAQVSVSVEIPANLPPVALDRPQVQGVLLDLLLDLAGESGGTSETTGRLTISAATIDADPATVQLRLERDGAPASLDEHGLAVSREIAAAHGGNLRVSTTAHDGTAVVIELPVRAAPTSAAPANAEDAQPLW